MTAGVSIDGAVVIVVEDNIDNLMIIQQLLRRSGVSAVNGRTSGRQFFKFLENYDKSPHLILLDLQIPEEDGYVVLQKIRADPRLRETRVIAITANVMQTDVDKSRQAGFDGFLGKPLQPERFSQQLTRLLAGEAVWEPH